MRGTTIELLWSHGIVCLLVRRSSRCAWGFYVAWTAGLHHKALFPHSTPERQSLCESHRQRRWLTHWSYTSSRDRDELGAEYWQEPGKIFFSALAYQSQETALSRLAANDQLA